MGNGPRTYAPKLLCGSTTILLFFVFFLWTTTSVLFVIGGLSDKLVCQTLEDPSNSETILYHSINTRLRDLINESLSIEQNQTITYDQLIGSCKEDKSLLDVLPLQSIHDLIDQFEYRNMTNINENDINNQLRKMIGNAISNVMSHLTIDEDTKVRLSEMADNLSWNKSNESGSEFDRIMNTNMSQIWKFGQLQTLQNDISEIQKKFDNTKNPLFSKNPKFAKISQEFGLLSGRIDTIKTLMTNNLTASVHNARTFLNAYRDTLMYNNTCDLHCVVDNIDQNLVETREYINSTTKRNAFEQFEKSFGRIFILRKL